MKRFYTIFLFCFAIIFLIPNFQFVQADDLSQNNTYFVTANFANVYSEPILNSEKIIGEIKHKEIVYLEMDNNTPKTFNDGDFTFYQLSEEIYSPIYNSNAFILTELVIQKSKEITSIPSFNAKTNSNCTVYFLKDNEKVESDIKLEKGTKIFLYEGYTRKKTFTAIAFINEKEIYYGYLETRYISPNGINPIIFTCIFLTLAVLGIIFAWVFMKRSKVRVKGKAYNLKNKNKK